MRPGPKTLTALAFSLALVLAAVTAGGGATLIEKRARQGVQLLLDLEGQSWAHVTADGLQVIVAGTAPDEALRFRTLTAVGEAIDPGRIVDLTEVARPVAVEPPRFSLEMLRNGDGISLIGLVPADTDRAALVASLRRSAAGAAVTDMLESADYPAPPGWNSALRFGVSALATLPRSKISVSGGQVAITAITDSGPDKARLETDLVRRTPEGLTLQLDISAPRPVITPFTLRFLIDAEGARFDACSADTEAARDQILTAARAAGAGGALGCTLGMGTPSPQWGSAVSMGLAALHTLGAGVITYSDTDVALIVPETVDAAVFDRAVGELESNLPDSFSLHAEHTAPQATATATPVLPEFFVNRDDDGDVQVRGRVGDELLRSTVQNVAAARFGHDAVYVAVRVDTGLPAGWAVRVLSAIEALAELDNGSVQVLPDLIRVAGETDDPQSSDTISRLLAARLGEGARVALSIRYVPPPEPEPEGLPPEDCVAQLNAVLAASKITFEPGSAVIAAEGWPALDALATILHECEKVPLQIAGHTDSQGREQLNQRLSQERARAVLVAMQQRRVLTANLDSQGFGESFPIADNGTEEGRESNRRIEFVLLTDAEAAAADEAAAVPASELADDAAHSDVPPAEADAKAGQSGADDLAADAAAESNATDAADTTDATDTTVDAAAAVPESKPSEPQASGALATEPAGRDTAADVPVQTPDVSTQRPVPRPARQAP